MGYEQHTAIWRGDVDAFMAGLDLPSGVQAVPEVHDYHGIMPDGLDVKISNGGYPFTWNLLHNETLAYNPDGKTWRLTHTG